MSRASNGHSLACRSRALDQKKHDLVHACMQWAFKVKSGWSQRTSLWLKRRERKAVPVTEHDAARILLPKLGQPSQSSASDSDSASQLSSRGDMIRASQ